MEIAHFLTFASEAEIVGLWGIACVAIAAIAGLADVRRTRRAAIDRVGWMPWRAIFLASAMIGAGLIALSLKGLAAP